VFAAASFAAARAPVAVTSTVVVIVVVVRLSGVVLRIYTQRVLRVVAWFRVSFSFSVTTSTTLSTNDNVSSTFYSKKCNLLTQKFVRN